MMISFEPTHKSLHCSLYAILDEGAYHNKRNALFEIGRFKEAIQAYNQALIINPNRSSTYFKRGNTFIQLEVMEEAIQDSNGVSIVAQPRLMNLIEMEFHFCVLES
jgi:tetratricopeptide (TPR) repeat protein